MRVSLPMPVVAIALLATPAAGQIIGGRTIRVTTQPFDGTQNYPRTSVSATLDGDLVVAWNEFRGGLREAFAQRFDQWGHRLGGEIHIAQPAAEQTRVAAIAAGGFVAVWDDGASMLRARCYDRDAVGGAVVTIGPGRVPDVAHDAAGNFVVAWFEAGGTQVFAQRFSSACGALGTSFVVSPTFSPDPLARPSVAVAPDGRFLVTWQHQVSVVDPLVIFGRRYLADGTPAGPATQLSDGAAYDQRASLGTDGSFVVTWRLGGVLARRFDPAGNPLGPSFIVSVGSSGSMPQIAHNTSGGFDVTWMVVANTTSIRRYSAAGVPGPVLTVGDTYLPAGFSMLGIAAERDDAVAVTWTRHEGPQYEVALRRFAPLAPRPFAVDGNGILEPGEDVEVRPSWANGTGTTASFTGAVTSFGGPAGLGVTYSLLDGTASYPTVADGATSSCSATGDCYRIGVSNPPVRPVAHWDALLDERVASAGGGTSHRWLAHVGRSFADIDTASPFYRFVETLLHAEVTAGCAAMDYCPASPVTREQMSVFVLRSRHEGYLSVECGGTNRRFDDVPASSPFCRWIEDLARRSVVSGCGGANYCPQSPVSREEMAVFVLSTKEGPFYAPPACGPVMFADVPAASPFCPWIEELARRGVVTGCGGGNYCPAEPVSREQMAVFLSVTFGLSLGTP